MAKTALPQVTDPKVLIQGEKYLFLSPWGLTVATLMSAPGAVMSFMDISGLIFQLAFLPSTQLWPYTLATYDLVLRQTDGGG